MPGYYLKTFQRKCRLNIYDFVVNSARSGITLLSVLLGKAAACRGDIPIWNQATCALLLRDAFSPPLRQQPLLQRPIKLNFHSENDRDRFLPRSERSRLFLAAGLFAELQKNLSFMKEFHFTHSKSRSRLY